MESALFDLPINVITAIIPAVIAVAEVAYIILGWSIWREFGWKVYKLLGADRQIKKMYMHYQILFCIMKFDVFFWVAFAIQVCSLLHSSRTSGLIYLEAYMARLATDQCRILYHCGCPSCQRHRVLRRYSECAPRDKASHVCFHDKLHRRMRLFWLQGGFYQSAIGFNKLLYYDPSCFVSFSKRRVLVLNPCLSR